MQSPTGAGWEREQGSMCVRKKSSWLGRYGVWLTNLVSRRDSIFFWRRVERQGISDTGAEPRPSRSWRVGECCGRYGEYTLDDGRGISGSVTGVGEYCGG